MDTHLPDVVAIERVFANANANTAMGTAQAAGVIALAAARRQIDVYFNTPSEVKAAVTGNGRADKAQMQRMVLSVLNGKGYLETNGHSKWKSSILQTYFPYRGYEPTNQVIQIFNVLDNQGYKIVKK